MKNTSVSKYLRSIKRTIQFIRGHDCFFHPDIAIEQLKLGSDYGGWNVPSTGLNASSIVYSAGIGTDISFDLALIERFGLRICAFDPTPTSLEWLKAQNLPSQFHSYPWGLSDHDGIAEFHIPKNNSHVSHSMLKSQVTKAKTVKVQVRKIESIMQELGHKELDLLKMDIEGAEYAVLEDLLSSSIRPSLLLVEFHHRFKSIGSIKTKQSMLKLAETGYRLYSVSPSGEEMCFIRS